MMKTKQYHIICFLLALLMILMSLCGFLAATAYAEATGETEATRESTPSPTLDDLYQVVSPYMIKSDFPIDLFEFECIRIDLDTEVVSTGNVVDGEFIFPALPTTLDLIFLYDGSHLVPAQWHWTDADRIYIAFDVESIGHLDGTSGLYVFLFAFTTEDVQ